MKNKSILISLFIFLLMVQFTFGEITAISDSSTAMVDTSAKTVTATDSSIKDSIPTKGETAPDKKPESIKIVQKPAAKLIQTIKITPPAETETTQDFLNLLFVDHLLFKWEVLTFFLSILPVPVIFILFTAVFFVFNFGMLSGLIMPAFG